MEDYERVDYNYNMQEFFKNYDDIEEITEIYAFMLERMTDQYNWRITELFKKKGE